MIPIVSVAANAANPPVARGLQRPTLPDDFQTMLMGAITPADAGIAAPPTAAAALPGVVETDPAVSIPAALVNHGASAEAPALSAMIAALAMAPPAPATKPAAQSAPDDVHAAPDDGKTHGAVAEQESVSGDPVEAVIPVMPTFVALSPTPSKEVPVSRRIVGGPVSRGAPVPPPVQAKLAPQTPSNADAAGPAAPDRPAEKDEAPGPDQPTPTAQQSAAPQPITVPGLNGPLIVQSGIQPTPLPAPADPTPAPAETVPGVTASRVALASPRSASGRGREALPTDAHGKEAAEARDLPAAALSSGVQKPDLAQTVATGQVSRPVDLSGAGGPAINPGAGLSADAVLTHHLDLAKDSAWLDGLARDIARSADTSGSLRFSLAPEHLGRLEVNMAQGAEGTAIRLTTETHEAHRILSEAQPRLVAEARAHGLTLTETSVDLGNRSGGGQPQAFGNQNSGGGGNTPHAPWWPAPSAPAPAATASEGERGGDDLYA